jgi:putative FmdB family regulatory protein
MVAKRGKLHVALESSSFVLEFCMPIYEFYCKRCHTIYSFFARSTNQKAEPACPKCGLKKLDRKMSRFAISRGLKEDAAGADDPFAGVDESRMEQAMMAMESEFENVDENNPQQMAHMMKRMFEAVGVEPNGAMLEAMRRMESGEDPDRIDEEMGDLLDESDPFSVASAADAKARMRRLLEPPNVDPELYDL